MTLMQPRGRQSVGGPSGEGATRQNKIQNAAREEEAAARYAGERALQSARLQLKKAQECRDAGQAQAEYQACVQCLDEAIAARVRLPQAFQLRGKCYVAMQQYQRAMSDFTQCIELDPQNSKNHGQRGLCFRRLYRHEDALRAFDLALKLEKSSGQDAAASQAQAAEYHYERALVYVDLAQATIADAQATSNDIMERLGEAGRQEANVARAPRDLAARENYLVAIKGLEEAKGRLASPFKAHFQLGVCFRSIGRLRESIENFQKAISLEEANADAYNQLGLSYVEDKNLEEAKACFSSAMELDLSVRHLNNHGLVCFHLQEYEEAISDFTAALHAEPGNAEILCNRGNACLKLSRYEDALQSYRDAIMLDPENALYYHHKGLAYEGQGNGQEAIDAFEEALRHNSDHQPSRFHLGLAYHLDGQLQRALDAFNACLPKDEALMAARGAVHRDMGNFGLAIADFDKVIAKQPGSGEHLYNRGVVWHLMGKSQDAVEDCTRAIEDGYQEAKVFFQRGMAFRALGNLPHAVKDLAAAIERDGIDGDGVGTDYLAYHAKCLYEQGLYNLAEVDLDKALERDPTNPALLYQRGLARYSQQIYSSAVSDFHNSIKYGGPEEACAADLYHHLGLSWANQYKYTAALASLDRAVSSSKTKLPHYLHERAKALQAMGRHQEALLDFNDVLDMQPTNAYALFRRAYSFKELGLYHEAAEDFEAAKEFAPHDSRLVINYRKVDAVAQDNLSLGPWGFEDQTPLREFRRPLPADPRLKSVEALNGRLGVHAEPTNMRIRPTRTSDTRVLA